VTFETNRSRSPTLSIESQIPILPRTHPMPYPHSMTLPPSDVPAERALLGALIADNWLYRDLRFLSPDDFADDVHAKIYAAIERRVQAGLPADAEALKEEFKGQLAEVGGTSYFDHLMPDESDPVEDAKVIRDLAQKR
jgi:replicative DNA helicase